MDFGIPNARFGPVSASPTSCGPQARTRPLGAGGFCSTGKPSQSTHVVRHVRHRDGGLGAGQADGSDRQPHPSLLVGEDVLDLRPVLRFAPVDFRGPRARRTAAASCGGCGGVRHDLAADDPVLLVDADVGLVAVDRNGDVDRLLHHAVVVRIEGASYRLRKHADLIPEHV